METNEVSKEITQNQTENSNPPENQTKKTETIIDSQKNEDKKAELELNKQEEEKQKKDHHVENEKFLKELNRNSKENLESNGTLKTKEENEIPALDYLEDDIEEENTFKSEKKTELEEIQEKEESVENVLREDPKEEEKEGEQKEESEELKGDLVEEKKVSEQKSEKEKNESIQKGTRENSDLLLEKQIEESNRKRSEESKSDLLKEENIIIPKNPKQEEQYKKDLKEHFPTDNESMETLTHSRNLTSRFNNQKPKSRPKKIHKVKLTPMQFREKNFDMTGLIHSKMKEYNSLKDESLKKFFCSPEKVRHMTRVGLITKSGLIIKNPENFLKMKSQKKMCVEEKLPSVLKRENRSEMNYMQKSTLSGKEVRKAIKAKSLKAKKKLQQGLSPLGRMMMKENKRKMKMKVKKTQKKRLSKKKFELYLNQVEVLYNIK